MSLFINKNSKIIIQGTGKVAQFHTKICRNYFFGKNAFVAYINPNSKNNEKIQNIKVYNNVYQAKKENNANISIIYVPPLYAMEAIWESVLSKIKLVICITEGIPLKDMLILKNRMKNMKSKTLLLGPNCPGVIIPEIIKIGIMPSHIHKKGNIGVISRSGTLTYEVVNQLSEMNLGQSCAIGIGGDPIHGLNYIDIIKKFNKDKNTIMIVIIGEIGGQDEINAAYWINKYCKKPVVGFIAGFTAPKGKKMGHAGALISSKEDKAITKLNIMKKCGIKVTLNLSEVGKIVYSIYKKI